MKVEAPPSCVQLCSMGKGAGLSEKERQAEHWNLSLCFLTGERMRPISSNSCHHHFPIIIECAIKVWDKLKPFLLKFLLSRYFVTVMKKVTNTSELLLPGPLSNKARKQTGINSHWGVDTSDTSLRFHGCKHLAGSELILVSPSSVGITQAIPDLTCL